MIEVVLDTETTGLPKGSPFGWGTYWDYRMNDKYDSCRIVSIAWASIHNFDKNNIHLWVDDTIQNGVKRTTMLLTNQSSIQEVLFFPQMRPEKVD